MKKVIATRFIFALSGGAVIIALSVAYGLMSTAVLRLDEIFEVDRSKMAAFQTVSAFLFFTAWFLRRSRKHTSADATVFLAILALFVAAASPYLPTITTGVLMFFCASLTSYRFHVSQWREDREQARLDLIRHTTRRS